jgi:hypothetical protein
LFLDFECAPVIGHVWGLFNQNVGLNQIKKDWHLMSAALSWDGEDKIHYLDQRNSKNIENDKALCKFIIGFINQADFLIGHNIKRYDLRKLFARCIKWGLNPPKKCQIIDTLQIARKHFAFTSNKQAYIADYLDVKRKDEHRDFPGFDLWSECLKGNPKAWRAIKVYNCDDLIGLKGMWKKLQPWEGGTFSQYVDHGHLCKCGSKNLKKKGFNYSKTGKFQAFRCMDCGAYSQSSHNLLDKLRKASITR